MQLYVQWIFYWKYYYQQVQVGSFLERPFIKGVILSYNIVVDNNIVLTFQGT